MKTLILLMLAVTCPAAHAQQAPKMSNEAAASILGVKKLAPETLLDFQKKKLELDLGAEWAGVDLTTLKGTFSGLQGKDKIEIQVEGGKKLEISLLKDSILRSTSGASLPIYQVVQEASVAKVTSLFQVAQKDGKTVLFRWHKGARELPEPGPIPPPSTNPKTPVTPSPTPKPGDQAKSEESKPEARPK